MCVDGVSQAPLDHILSCSLLGNQESLLPPCRNGHSAESGKVHKSQVSFLSFLPLPVDHFYFESFWGNNILFCVFTFLEQTFNVNFAGRFLTFCVVEPAHYSVNLKNSFNSQKLFFAFVPVEFQRTLWALFKKLISLLYKKYIY